MTDTDYKEEDPQSTGALPLTFETALLRLRASNQVPGSVTEAEIVETYAVMSSATQVPVPLSLMPSTQTSIVTAGTGGAATNPAGNKQPNSTSTGTTTIDSTSIDTTSIDTTTDIKHYQVPSTIRSKGPIESCI